MQTNRHWLRLLVVCVLAAFTLGLAACGDDDNDKGGGTPAAGGGTATPGKAKQGGKLTMLVSSDTDYLDPGHTYYSLGYVFQYAISTPLYYYAADKTEIIPYLADGPVETSADGKTVTVKIKKGWKFGPPVNREVTTKDIKYAFERFFSENVGGQYPGYFQPIVGAPKAPTKGVKPISGITTPDDYTIVFKLDKPVPPFAASLVMPITMPVPKEYAAKLDKNNPSTYNTHVVATGPYMVKNDTSGKLVGYKVGKSISLVRNPNWDGKAWGDPRPAYLDSIFVRTNASDSNVASRQVLNGKGMITNENPPANVLKEVVTKIKDQYKSTPQGAFRYFPLNTTVKPFDDLNVRKAVLAGFDRTAVILARGGKYVGDVPTHWLPPNFPGFKESGGPEGFGIDYLSQANGSGDLALAAKYFKAAGYKSGKYEGKEKLLMVGSNADPGKAVAEVGANQLKKLGFNVKLRLVPQDAVYTDWCQVPGKNVAMCGGANWGKDFDDPQSMIEPLFKGSLINPKSGNINYSELNDPALDKLMDKAAAEPAGENRLKLWADVNKKVVEDAAAVPYIWDRQTVLRSKNVVPAVTTYTGLWDLSFLGLSQ